MKQLPVFNNSFKKTFMAAGFLICLVTVFAQNYSTQPHFSTVTALAYREASDTVFSCGEDGMVIAWNNTTGTGDHFQCSNLPIRAIALNPQKNEIAIYETDNTETFRVTVIDWTYKNKKYTKTFKDSVTCIAFSAQGTYLIVGTTSLKGVNFFLSENGMPRNLLSASIGAVTMAKTSGTESTLVVYSPTGLLSYYDLKKGTEKGHFAVEPNLEQPVLFNNNVSFADYKDNKIYTIAATTGKTESTAYAYDPIFCTVDSDAALYYAQNDSKLSTIYSVAPKGNAAREQAFSYKDEPKSIVKTAGGYYIGTSSGDIYKLNKTESYAVSQLEPLTTPTYAIIKDICTTPDGNAFILTESEILHVLDDGCTTEPVLQNSGFTNISATDENLYLWNKNTRKPIYAFNFTEPTDKPAFVYTPSYSIQFLKTYGDKILLLEGNSAVTLIDALTNTVINKYTGTGYLDAALINGTEIYVGKSSATNPKVPFLLIDTKTGETVSLNIKANAVYSFDTANGMIFGQMYTENNSAPSCSIFTFRPEQRDYKILWTEKGESTSSFMQIVDGTLFTDFSKNQLVSINLSNTSQRRRLASGGVAKVAVFDNKLYILNSKGTLFVHENDSDFTQIGNVALSFDNQLIDITQN
ncbi:MAG: WD40 repeat domain-containing protein [Spirochaetaceae bacterium]|nr:WD40 repeat domain-containing protein [Spirochaetaceae bacterium]